MDPPHRRSGCGVHRAVERCVLGRLRVGGHHQLGLPLHGRGAVHPLHLGSRECGGPDAAGGCLRHRLDQCCRRRPKPQPEPSRRRDQHDGRNGLPDHRPGYADRKCHGRRRQRHADRERRRQPPLRHARGRSDRRWCGDRYGRFHRIHLCLLHPRRIRRRDRHLGRRGVWHRCPSGHGMGALRRCVLRPSFAAG